MFPLSLVAYPGESLNLHIFEPRYKELVSDCVAEKKTFGIPSFIDDNVTELGTEMEILSVESTYDTGEMDIRTRGLKVFRILEFLKDVPDKQYSAGVISYPEDIQDHDVEISSMVFGYLRQLQNILNIQKPHFEKPSEITSFKIANHVGLSLKQEYDLLAYVKETDRMKFIANHLKKTIPIVKATEEMRVRARLNGHFRNENPPKF